MNTYGAIDDPLKLSVKSSRSRPHSPVGSMRSLRSSAVSIRSGSSKKSMEGVPLVKRMDDDGDDEECTDIYGRPQFKENASWQQFRRVLRFLGPESKLALLATFFGFAGTCLSLISPQYGGAFFDAIVDIRTDCIFMNSSDCDISGTMWPISMIVTFSLTGLLISNLGSFCFSLAGRRVIARTRKELFHAYLHQDMFFFDVKGVGELLSRIGPDVSQIEGVTTSFASLLNSVVTLIGSLVMMLLINRNLTIITLAAFPIWGFTAYLGGKIIARLNFVCNNLLADQAGYATDILGMISTVRSFGQEQRESRIFGTFTDRVYRLAVRMFLATQALTTVDSLVGLLARVVLLWLGAKEVVNQRLTFGQLVAFQSYSGMASGSFNELAGLYATLMSMIGGSQVIVALLDSFKMQDKIRTKMPPKVAQQVGVERRGRDPSKIEKIPLSTEDVVFDQVHFCYPNNPEAPVLSNFSVRFGRDQMTALVGPSGSGKSSVLALLLRYYEPVGGRICYGGADLQKFDIRDWRRCLALVTQEPVLLSGTVRENIGYGRDDLDEAAIAQAAEMAGATEFISKLPLGFETRLGRLAGGQTLSGGQKQRIAIARAIARNPRLLLLDEPTSALDKENEELISNTVEKMRAGRIIIMVTHNLDSIIKANNIVVTVRGQVVEQGDHSSLLQQKGAYWQFYRSTAVESQQQDWSEQQ